MKGDFSKDSFHPEKHFHDVLMQQGRVLLDAEWNEQASINAYRTETGVRDIVGKSGTPFDETNPEGSFQILPANGNADVTITKGHYYVDGILCENEHDVLFVNQPDLNAEALPTSNANGDGDYLFYLNVWKRHITVLEDPAIREVALGGPDTTTRVKTIWQVKWKGPAAVNCANALDAQITADPTGKLLAKSKPAQSKSDPCGLAESGGYTRLENQLYRVEIHTGAANRASSTFKWSRDNGIVAVKWESQDSADKDKLVVSTIGRDEILSFKEGDWIELIDDRTDLLGKPGVLVELAKVEGNTLIIDPSTIKDPDNSGATSVSILNRTNPRIRRWDSTADIKLNTATWIGLEDGIEVKFEEGTFRTGDYWLIPARTAIADIEWPFTQSQLPFGVKHHYALLGILKLTAGVWSVVSDCRSLFPPLTDLISLFYVSGDGQEAMPGNALPQPLVVGVSNGQWPVENASVKFTLVTAGVGSITPNGIVITNNLGLASCSWTLGGAGTPSSQQVKAELLDAAGSPMHLPVVFTANQSIASQVLYDGNGCQDLDIGFPGTVEQAITALCMQKNGKRKCSVTIGEGGDFKSWEEAVEKLQKEEDICICFLAGSHKIGESTLGLQETTKTIKISGCGATLLLFGKEFKLRAEKIILQGLNIESGDFNIDVRIFLTAHWLHAENCRFFFHAKEIYHSKPFVLVEAYFTESIMTNADINLVNNIFETDKAFSRTALGLGERVQGSLKNNRFEGDVMLMYNEKIEFTDLDWAKFLTDHGHLPNKQAVEGSLLNTLEFLTDNAALHITGNTMGRARTNANVIMRNFENILNNKQMDKFQPAYRNIVVAENIFESVIGSFVAELVTLSDNHFINKERNVLVVFAIGFRGIFSGNMDYVFMDQTTGGIIETLFNGKIDNSNLIEIR